MPKKREDPMQDPFGITVVADKQKFFEFFRWREAFKYWQDKIWSGQFNIRPQAWGVILSIHTREPAPFGGQSHTSILFSPQTRPHLGYYEAIGSSERDIYFPERQSFVHAGPDVRDFELTIARFARNREIQGLVLEIPNPVHVRTLVLANEHGRLRIGIEGR